MPYSRAQLEMQVSQRAQEVPGRERGVAERPHPRFRPEEEKGSVIQPSMCPFVLAPGVESNCMAEECYGILGQPLGGQNRRLHCTDEPEFKNNNIKYRL